MAILQKTTPSISIVIGTLNRPKVLESLLDQLIKVSTSVPLEVIVIDQSTIELHKELVKIFPKKNNFILLRLEKPNTCKYLNMGWKKATSSIVLYLDDDVTITDTTIQAHIDSYNDINIKGVAGRVINDNEAITTDNQVGKISFFGAQFSKNFSYTKKCFVDFPYGCNMSFRKQTLKEVEGFDENIQPPVYAYNEIDLGLRISKKWENSIIFEPGALVYHHQFKNGGTRAYDKKIYDQAVSRNYGYFLGKNYNFAQNILCFIRRLPFQVFNEPSEILNIISGYTYGKK